MSTVSMGYLEVEKEVSEVDVSALSEHKTGLIKVLIP